MKLFKNTVNLLIAFLLFTGYTAAAQTTKANTNSNNSKQTEMKTFVIEREIPGLGNMTPGQLKEVSKKSCSVLAELGSDIQWIQSYVTGNKMYCIYKALNADLIREHAKKGGFPCNNVSEVETVISPATATAKLD